METGELLTRWTACAAFLSYVGALVLRATTDALPDQRNLIRACWTTGCLFLLFHAWCAFQFVHRWSHAAAYDATARQTAEVTGLNTGTGLFLNYLLVLLWLCDATWWWLSARRYEMRSRIIEWTMQGFLGFMWFNATVVFGHSVARWLGVAASVLLAALWMRRRSRTHEERDRPGLH